MCLVSEASKAGEELSCVGAYSCVVVPYWGFCHACGAYWGQLGWGCSKR
jgi:hypothetical protein